MLISLSHSGLPDYPHLPTNTINRRDICIHSEVPFGEVHNHTMMERRKGGGRTIVFLLHNFSNLHFFIFTSSRHRLPKFFISSDLKHVFYFEKGSTISYKIFSRGVLPSGQLRESTKFQIYLAITSDRVVTETSNLDHRCKKESPLCTSSAAVLQISHQKTHSAKC